MQVLRCKNCHTKVYEIEPALVHGDRPEYSRMIPLDEYRTIAKTNPVCPECLERLDIFDTKQYENAYRAKNPHAVAIGKLGGAAKHKVKRDSEYYRNIRLKGWADYYDKKLNETT